MFAQLGPASGRADPVSESPSQTPSRIDQARQNYTAVTTGQRDLTIPQALQRRLGHADCGIYAEVMEGGSIAAGDTIAAEQPELL